MKSKALRFPIAKDPAKFALLVIDVQSGLFQKAHPVFHAEEFLHNILALVEKAHHSSVPVIYIQHSSPSALVMGSPEWQLHPRLHPLHDEKIIQKQHPNAFEDTKLGETLQAMDIGSLVICGMVTHGCVKATCIGALELGYHVVVAKDAHSNFNEQAPVLIDKWNQEFEVLKADVKPTTSIAFSQGG